MKSFPFISVVQFVDGYGNPKEVVLHFHFGAKDNTYFIDNIGDYHPNYGDLTNTDWYKIL